MINYSIIIPHKNSPELLANGLATIPLRDDVQVIVVDDNSDVSLVDFSNFPQWNGVHYECYFTKEGKGAGYARNIGLSHAIGKWVLFMDADDYILPSVNEIFDEYLYDDADVIYFRPQAIMQEDYTTISKRANLYNFLIDSYMQTADENEIRTRFYVPWSKFVKRSLIERYSIKFEEIPYSNDVVFSIKVGCYANSISVQDKSFYVVTESTKSLTSKFLSKPGELNIRAKACLNAQKVIYGVGRPLDHSSLINYLIELYKYSKLDFFSCFNQTLSVGYTRIRLMRKIFASHRMLSKIKHGLYVLFFSYLLKNKL